MTARNFPDRRSGPPGGRPPPGGPGGGRPGLPPEAGLPPGYLRGGYFDEGGNLRPELILDHARQVAQALLRDMAYSQLRIFWTHVTDARRRLLGPQAVPFEAVRPQVLKLDPQAKNAVGRGVAPPVFAQFVEQNLQLAARDRRHFEGFFEHFQAIIQYHKYLESQRSQRDRRTT